MNVHEAKRWQRKKLKRQKNNEVTKMAVKWFQTGAGCINDGGTDREKEQKTLVKLKKV